MTTNTALYQIAKDNSGFIQDYVNSFPASTESDHQEVMKYHARGTLPALHTLAQHFTVCDHWFSSLPGPTWPNRLFVHSGTSLGHVTMPEGVMNANLHWLQPDDALRPPEPTGSVLEDLFRGRGAVLGARRFTDTAAGIPLDETRVDYPAKTED